MFFHKWELKKTFKLHNFIVFIEKTSIDKTLFDKPGSYVNRYNIDTI